MKRQILIVCLTYLTTISLCSCSRENKLPDRPSSPSAAQPPAARSSTSEPSSSSGSEARGLGAFVSFPACGIKIRHPDGFEKADSFDGFEQPDTQSSVMVVTIPGPSSEVTAGFTTKQAQARGWTLRSRQDVKVDDLPGILVHFEQPAGGQVFLKWTLVFGDDQNTTIVTSTVPKTQGRGLSDRLKAAILTARPDGVPSPSPQTDLPLSIAPSPKLKLASVLARMFLYTKDGVFPAKSPRDPLFVAGRSLGKFVAENKRQFAEWRLRQTAHTTGLAVKTTSAITVDGLDGYESLADADDAESGTPLIVYQMILFDEEFYIMMQGLVGRELRDEYLPEFKIMARTMHRRHP